MSADKARKADAALTDARELLAESKRDADGWCERATNAERNAEFWEREYEAAQNHVRQLQSLLGIPEEGDGGDD